MTFRLNVSSFVNREEDSEVPSYGSDVEPGSPGGSEAGGEPSRFHSSTARAMESEARPVDLSIDNPRMETR